SGFSSSSGGATRYVPPAFRNAVGGDEDKAAGPADGCARRLGEIVAIDGGRNTRRFVTAALFLLTTTCVSSAARTVGRGKERGSEETSQGGGGSESTGETDDSIAPLSLPLRSAARSAKAELGCDDYRRLPAESGVLGSSDGQNNSWWVKLRQADRGWLSTDPEQRLSTDPEQREGATTSASGDKPEREAWVGLELQLRASDVCCAEGQAAIVNFLKGRLGTQVPREQDGEEGGDEDEDARSLVETRSPDGAEQEPCTISSGAEARPVATSRDERHEMGGMPSGGSGSVTECHRRETVERGRRVDEDATVGAGGAQRQRADDRPPKIGKYASVLVAVLVFGRELSKRDRAELHGQAERVGGVASASHGMGDERFLTLTCGLGGRAGAVELELSPEKVGLERT
ncbi:unnamed protein product, partial [Hapterophycus canaliculatus]